ncbi:HyaD/HybD family hydrogenase maturation endopeptidase [Pseudorhodoferax sp.]|uniref:HyaD/HybD family hydrogenase maturation endopeptidase n=1 Tax=Pseudorhodoferax sp. TaxID=1993553 RepID=UPI002DD689E5|nr:HyaD/HybD family hydrogenase maturation endopeptidase [Pseudorhodoferax sp.]
MTAVQPAIVVLGIGNLLWADEGFGVRCAEALAAGWHFAPGVQVVDGGTQGLYLLPQVQAATHLLIFDAVDYGLPPGTLKLVEDDEVPRFLGARKMSLHQTGFQEVLSLARLTGHWPAHVLLVGCQPAELDDFGGSLTPPVKTALPQALAAALQRLRAWGADPQPALQDTLHPAAAAEPPTVPVLAMGAYEEGRPSAARACRIGDERFLPPARQGEEAAPCA